jgi:hypothetical protein
LDSSARRSLSARSRAAVFVLGGAGRLRGRRLRSLKALRRSFLKRPAAFLLLRLGLFGGWDGFPLHVGHEGAQILGGDAVDLPRQAVDLAVGVHEDVIAPVALGENEAMLLKGRLKRLPVIA